MIYCVAFGHIYIDIATISTYDQLLGWEGPGRRQATKYSAGFA